VTVTAGKQDYSFEDMLLTHAPVLPPPKA